MADVISTVKVLVVGPARVGKSTVSNFLAEQTDTLAETPYNATVGARILECERELTGQGGSWDNVQLCAVELWDVSGDQTYEGCWPAIMQDVNGVILMYNPENRGHEHEVTLWHDVFVKNSGMDDSLCLVLAHRPQPSSQRVKPPRQLQRAKAVVSTSYESGGMIRREFDRFLEHVVSVKNAAAAAEEEAEEEAAQSRRHK